MRILYKSNIQKIQTKKNILNKIRKIACYLEDQNCGNTAELLRKIDLNTLTPIAALNLLFELKNKI